MKAGRPDKPSVPLAQTGLLPQPLPKKRLFRGTAPRRAPRHSLILIFQ